jgi:hypothetical protein
MRAAPQLAATAPHAFQVFTSKGFQLLSPEHFPRPHLLGWGKWQESFGFTPT